MSVRNSVDSFLSKFEKKFITHNLIEVSRSSLLHNLDLFVSETSQQVIPVLKANAYGHGIEIVATALKDRQLAYVAVDGYFEALRIREVSDQPVLIMGAILPENFAHLKFDNFTFVVQDEPTIRAIGKTGKHIKVHLECNTGMNRYGAKVDELAELTRLILSYKNLEFEGVMSHLADSDGDDQATVDEAVELFDRCIDEIRSQGANPVLIHVAQSAGSLRVKSKYANAMRLGIALYGINPFPHGHALHTKLRNNLQPALKLSSTITKVIKLNKGDKVSYNYTFTAPKGITIGVLPLGYFEGSWSIARGAGKKAGLVKVGQKFTPIVGRVCMNHTMISLDGIPAKVGDKVVVYSNKPGEKNAIDAIAHDYGLFNYTLLTSLNSDLRRVLVD